MKIEFSESMKAIRMNGQSGAAPRGFIAAVKNIAARDGLAIIHLGWDGLYTHEVEMPAGYGAIVKAEMERIVAASDAAIEQAVSRRCPKCGRHGTYTTSRTVCDDCAA
jgi:hypothetical protein